MDRLVDALTRLIENPNAFQGKRPAAPRAIKLDLADAPATVKRLAEALATRYYNVDLGELSMFAADDGGPVASLADTCTAAAEGADLDLAAALPDGFDPARTLLLGADGGGMSYFGVSWADGVVSFVVVEFEDPTEENFVQVFRTPAAWLAFLDHKRRDDAPTPDLEALRAALA